MQLRPYQRTAVTKVRRAFSDGHKGVLCVAPTGSGKTVLAALGIIQPAAMRGLRVTFAVHLREVVDAASRALDELGIEHGIVMAGRKPRPSSPVQVCSIQTVASRGAPPTDLLIIDEAHRAAASQYRKLVKANDRARVVGLTATAVRSDNKSLRPPDAPFTELVQVIQPEELIEQGFLVDAHVYGADTPDLERLKVDPKTRDWDRRQTSEAYTRDAKLVGDAVEQWRRHAAGKRTVTFCCSRSHGRQVCDAFLSAGIPAAYVDGTTSQATRTEQLARLRRGEVLVLVNVDVFTEGWDEPLLECVQVLRPTLSVGRWIQMAGRGLRTINATTRAQCRKQGIAVPNKRHVIVLDHGGNAQRHGLPTASRQWSLEADAPDPLDSARRGGRATAGPQLWTCPKCGRVLEHKVIRCTCGQRAADVLPRVLSADLVRLMKGEIAALG